MPGPNPRLRSAQASYLAAKRHADDKRRIRNAAIHLAIESGMTQSQIATLTGLTRGRVAQIASQD
jgi:predicted XRE-type DNA-binding protein